MFVKYYKKLWLMKAELKKLEILKSPTKNIIVLFMCLGVIPIVRTMKVKMFIPLNLFGPPMINLACAVLLSRFTKIGRKDLLLMYANAREYLMNCIKMDTSRCRMSYHRLKNLSGEFIANFIMLSLIPLMIVICLGDKFNRLSMKTE